MTDTFFNLPDEKKERVINGCIDEFGEYGYELGSTDRIIKRIGISKGGLYEYIKTKEELFLYIVEFSFKSLYSYIEKKIRMNNIVLPNDIIERHKLVYTIAIDYYLEHPEIIKFIVKINSLSSKELLKKTDDTFIKHFNSLFWDIDESTLMYNKEKVLNLLRWLLIKTRDEFLNELSINKNLQDVKNKYFNCWDFYISVLKKGIYK